MTNENLITPPSASFLSRLGRGLKYAFRGNIPIEPLGAGQALPPVWQQLKGRQLDYDFGANYQITPRQNESIDFRTLRFFSEECSILRSVVEGKKEEMLRLEWDIANKDGTKSGNNVKKIKEFFMYPDKENMWDTWLKMILEDIFVIDACCIYPRFTRSGALYSLELIDGSMIKRIIDNHGRTPIPPLPAYQQNIHGIQSVDYTADELMYLMRNPRTSKIYGYSPVEQIKTIVETALRKQSSQLEYYTAGSIPDMIISVPELWSVDQIKEFQKYWDELLSGDTKQRRRARFVPQMKEIKQTKEAILKDEFDEWLTRVICYTFSVSPNAFIKTNNRATAEVVEEASEIRGLKPLMKWVKGIMDLIIVKYFRTDQIHFIWQQDEEPDPLIMAQINDIYVKNGVMSVNEIRDSLGLSKIDEKQQQTNIQSQQQDQSQTHESTEGLSL